MKKYTAVLCILLLSALLLGGCSSGGDDRESQLETMLADTYTDLTGTFSGSGSSFTIVEDYIHSWAKDNEIKVLETSDSYVVLRNSATKGNKNAESVTLQCSISSDDMESGDHTLAAALTALLGPDEHGPLTLIVTEAGADSYTGAEALPRKYLKTDHLINLDSQSKSALRTKGAYAFDAHMYRGVKYREPTYSNAYEITMTIGSYKDAFDFIDKYPNPITVISSYLATNRSSGKLFELADWSCKISGSGTPSSASAVVVIDENNVSSMQNRFEKSYESVRKRCEELGVNFVFTMTKTSMPDETLEDASADRIISLLYTLDPGIYYQDETSGEIICADEIASMKLTKKNFVLKLSARSRTKESLAELKQTLITTAGLNDTKYNFSEDYVTWGSSEKLSSFFSEALQLKETAATSTIKTSDLNVLSAKQPGLNCIRYAIGTEDDKAGMVNPVHFMSSLVSDEEQADQ